MIGPAAICARCAADKDLPLGRCAGCGHLPATALEREEAVLASRRLLDEEDLRRVDERVRRGERLEPGPAARARARAVLHGDPDPGMSLTTVQIVGLLAANVLLTPLVGWAAWLRWRARPGVAGRQALIVTVPVSVALAVLWLWWGVQVR